MSPSPRIQLSERDRRILALATRLTRDPGDFGETVRALHEAVAALIPAGRVYLLGDTEHGPVLGSIISGIGVTETASAVLVVRRDATLGFAPLFTLAMDRPARPVLVRESRA